MINIEQYALRAFKQYPRPCLADIVQTLPHRLRIFEDEGCNFFQVSNQARTVNRWLAKSGA